MVHKDYLDYAYIECGNTEDEQIVHVELQMKFGNSINSTDSISRGRHVMNPRRQTWQQIQLVVRFGKNKHGVIG